MIPEKEEEEGGKDKKICIWTAYYTTHSFSSYSSHNPHTHDTKSYHSEKVLIHLMLWYKEHHEHQHHLLPFWGISLLMDSGLISVPHPLNIQKIFLFLSFIESKGDEERRDVKEERDEDYREMLLLLLLQQLPEEDSGERDGEKGSQNQVPEVHYLLLIPDAKKNSLP